MTRWTFPTFPTTVGFVAALTLAAGCGQPERVTSREDVVVEFVSGAGTKSGRPIRRGDVVSAGETVIADEGASIVVRVRDQAAVQIKNSSKLVFEDLGDTLHLALGYGSLLSAASPNRLAGKKFVVTTPAATVGVRGTTFYTESRSLDQTYLCLCDGRVKLQTAADEQDMETSRKHSAVNILPDAAGRMKLTPAKMLGHTDAEVNLLENVLEGRR